MLKRSDEELSLLGKAREYLVGGTLGNVNLPANQAFILRSGHGSRVYDVSGNEYIDYLLGSGPMFLGHAHPAVLQAVSSQLDKGTTFYTQNEAAVLLAEQIVKAIPCAEKVRFTTNGTDATFQCLRLARAHRKLDTILKFEGGYHGSHDYGMMSVAPLHPKEFPQASLNSAGIPKLIQDLVLIAPFNDLETTTAIIEKHHAKLACAIIEPIQRLLPPKPGFLQGLREITSYYGIPLIFDEVVTGFRLAYGGAQEYYSVVPDLAALGKIIGGGYPLGAVVGNEELMSAYDPALEGTTEYVPQIGTLSGNPVSAIAGLATLEVLRKDVGIYQRVFDSGRYLRETLEQLLHQAEIPAQTVGEDVMFDVFFTDVQINDYRSTLSADNKLLSKFNSHLLENGVLKGHPKFYMGACHTPRDIQETINAFERSVEALRG